jgi:hypothetical protein
MTGRWHAMRVTIPHSRDAEATVRAVRRFEQWLAANHRPVALFTPAGRPRSRHVCFAVPVEQASKALAFKLLCREMGLERQIVQWRITA